MGIRGMRGSWGGGMDAGKGKEEAEGAEARGRNEKRDGAEAGTGEMGIGGMRGSWGGSGL